MGPGMHQRRLSHDVRCCMGDRGGEDTDHPTAAGGRTSARQLDHTSRSQDVQSTAQSQGHTKGGPVTHLFQSDPCCAVWEMF